ncbi:MAG: ApbE family lipoprotein [Chitinophagaceae bacterium]|nr:ApbE family lipoprotein [Chitinophagaceae bacterium]
MAKWFLLIVFFPVCTHAQLTRFSFTQPKMGSYFTITLYDTDSLHASELANECYKLVDSLNEIYSDYIPGSELNRLSATAGKKEWVKVSAALLDILMESQRAWKLSKGAFDITIGPVVRLWRKARKENKFPGTDSVARVLKATGFQYVLIDSANSRIQLTKPHMQLDLGGIGQGYMAQKVHDHLAKNNIKMTLIDASGDIVLGESPPAREGWRIAVNVPESSEELLDRQIVAHNKAVITSGDVYQYITHNGKKYSHIIDPATGYGVTNQRNATVIAGDGITADWLATTCTILSIKKIKKLARQLDAEFLIGTLKNGKLHFYKSKNFDKMK